MKHIDLCLTLVNFARGSMIVMKMCDDSENQQWRFRDGGLFQHTKLNVCLDSRYAQTNGVTAERYVSSQVLAQPETKVLSLFTGATQFSKAKHGSL